MESGKLKHSARGDAAVSEQVWFYLIKGMQIIGRIQGARGLTKADNFSEWNGGDFLPSVCRGDMSEELHRPVARECKQLIFRISSGASWNADSLAPFYASFGDSEMSSVRSKAIAAGPGIWIYAWQV